MALLLFRGVNTDKSHMRAAEGKIPDAHISELNENVELITDVLEHDRLQIVYGSLSSMLASFF